MTVRFAAAGSVAVMTMSLAGSLPALAQEAAGPTARPYQVVTEDQLTWSLDPEFPELDHAVFSGDLRSAGPYVYRLRANAPAAVPLHTHGRTEYVTVLRGLLHHAPEGATRDDAVACGPGCFVVIPAGRGHQAWLETGTVLQVHGVGPVEAHEGPGTRAG